MTEKQCLYLYQEMLKNDEGKEKYLIKEMKRLFKSGGIDTDLYDVNYNPYTLPRILLKASLMNYTDEIALVNEKRDMKIVKNLRCF